MVRKGTSLIIGCFICLVLIFSAGSTYALSIADSAAYIDWSSISFTGVPVSWLWQESYSEGEAEDDIDYSSDDDYEVGWVDTSASAITSNAEGNARTTDTGLSETAWAQANGVTGWAFSWAMAERYGDFEALGTGTLTISVPYSISQDLSTQYPDEYAWGWSYAGLDLSNVDTGDSDYDESEPDFWNIVWDGDSGHWADSGTLSVSLDFEQGNRGDFYAWVGNEAYVESEYVIPEPTSLMLLGFGLFGFGLSRKKIKREGR